MGTEYLIKVGSKYPDLKDPRHFSQWRDGQVIDVREMGFHRDKKSRTNHCIIQFPDADYWAIRGTADWKSNNSSVLELKKIVSTPEKSGKFLWELPTNYERVEEPEFKRPYFVDFLWLLENGHIDLSQYESVYDKYREHKPIILHGVGLYDILRTEGVHERLSSEKDQTKGSESTGTFTIGAAGTYATISAFEADIAAQLTGNLTGEHLSEETSISSGVTFDCDTNTYTLKLTAQSGAEHNGGAYGNGARIKFGTYDRINANETNNGDLDDFEISKIQLDISGAGNTGINFDDGGDSGLLLANRMLIKGDASSTAGIKLDIKASNARVTNNIIYGIGNGSGDCGINLKQNVVGSLNFYVANNTCIKNYSNIYQEHATLVGNLTLYNNLTQGDTGGDDFGDAGAGFGSTHSKNVSEDATSPDASYQSLNCHDGNSCFTNYGSDDYRLTAGGDELSTLDDGDDLSGTFTDDVVGTVRSTWYIGAYELEAGVTVSPTAISAIAGKVDPTVVRGSISIGPSALSSVVSSVNPTVIKGSVVISPSVLAAIALSIDPSVIGGGVTVAPSQSDSIVTTVNPTVVLGNVTILPSPSDSIVSSVNPTVVLGSVSISPDALTSIVLSIDPSVVGGSVVVSPTAIYAIAKTVGASVPEQQTALRFNYNATFVDFRMDELRLVEVTHIQKADQFWDQDNKFHQYFVGKLFKKIRIVFRQDDSDTYGKIETIWNQVDTYNQPKKITLYYRFKIDSDSLLVQMDRSAFEKKYFKHSRSAQDVETIFVETES